MAVNGFVNHSINGNFAKKLSLNILKLDIFKGPTGSIYGYVNGNINVKKFNIFYLSKLFFKLG